MQGKTKKLAKNVALGSLIIQNHEDFSDVKTAEVITENLYMQYFIGLSEFILEKPFDSSMMVHFRKRIIMDMINEINDLIVNPKKR